MKLAWIGLGVMGYPMAGHLARAKHELTVYNRTRAKADKWVKEYGGRAVATPREAAAGADIVFSCVGNDNDLRAITLGADGAFADMRKGAIYVDHSTVSANVARELEQTARAAGFQFLDAPVSGGQAGAEKGILTVMVGGDAQAFDACKPALESFASSIFHLGQLGAGQVGKMVNNMILWSCISANFEGFKLAQALDVDLDRLRTALIDSSASNWALQTQIDRFPMPWAEKDMRIVLSEADHLRLSVPLCGVVTEVVKSVKRERGWPTPALRET